MRIKKNRVSAKMRTSLQTINKDSFYFWQDGFFYFVESGSLTGKELPGIKVRVTVSHFLKSRGK